MLNSIFIIIVRIIVGKEKVENYNCFSYK